MEQQGSVPVLQRLRELAVAFSQENIALSQACGAMQLYADFINWIKDNGAVYSAYIRFPAAIGPLGVIGCKAVRGIEGDSALLFIPKAVIISSDDYHPAKKHKGKGRLTNSLKLTLFVLDEYLKGKESHWFPYISLILGMNYSSFPVNWNESQRKALNNKAMLSEIDDFNDEITSNYKGIKGLYTSSKVNGNQALISIDLFKTFYLFAVSRLFYFTDNTSYLIPLADLLNHSPTADVKYEVFDSVNYTMKYTSALDTDHSAKNLSSYTNCSMFFEEKKPSPISQCDNDELLKPMSINIDSEEEIQLKPSDYFVISTNSSQSFKANEEIHNNYGKSSNAYLLINFGFCLIDNIYDFSKIQMRLPKGDKAYCDLITSLFDDFEEDDECFSFVLRVKKRKVNVKVIDYFRMNYAYEKGLQCYIFTNDCEVKVLNDVTDFYSASISQDDTSLLTYIDRVEQETNEGKVVEAYSTLFKMTQKINLLYQKDYIAFLIKLCSEANKSALSYRDTMEHYDKLLTEHLFELAERPIAVKAIHSFLMKWTSLNSQ